MLYVQNSFRSLLHNGSLEDRTATFELPINGSRVNNFDGVGAVAVHELMIG